MTMLTGMGLDILHTQTVWASHTMAVTKKHGWCLISGYRVVNKEIWSIPGEMPDLKAEMG